MENQIEILYDLKSSRTPKKKSNLKKKFLVSSLVIITFILSALIFFYSFKARVHRSLSVIPEKYDEYDDLEHFPKQNGLTCTNLKELREFIKDFQKVKYEDQLIPTLEEIKSNGESIDLEPSSDHPNEDIEYSYYFTIQGKRQFKVLHLTDSHLGCGKYFTTEEDKLALRAIAAIVTVEKPDLVIFTGDVTSAWPKFGNINNIIGPKIIVELMQKLGVYWTIAYGNHESEWYMFYSREEISDYYEEHSFMKNETNYCLFYRGKNNVTGFGNYAINIKNKNKKILKSLILLDSHDYYYDEQFKKRYYTIQKDQVEWYEATVKKFSLYNEIISNSNKENLISLNELVVPSELFFHIPINTMKDGVKELLDNKGQKTKDFERIRGDINENPCSPDEIHSAEDKYRLINKVLELKSTDAMHFGHDHVNTAKILYKGVLMSYGMSLDFDAYKNIDRYGRQRGCTLIVFKLNDEETKVSRAIANQNYYMDKYKVVEGIPQPRVELTEEEKKAKFNKDYPDWLMDP